MDNNTNNDNKRYWLPDTAYNILKWVGLIALPALAWCVSVIAPAWGLPHVTEIVTTLNALGTLVGILIGASTLKPQE